MARPGAGKLRSLGSTKSPTVITQLPVVQSLLEAREDLPLVFLSLWVITPLGIACQISHISNIYL